MPQINKIRKKEKIRSLAELIQKQGAKMNYREQKEINRQAGVNTS